VGMLAALCLLASFAAAGTTKNTSSTSPKSTASSSSSRSKKKSKKSKKVRGQKAIDATRTKQIQQALIEQKYMQGEPSGKWDDTTQAALRKYQADHGWQSKTVPDSRALIKLGLGPSKEGLLNPETAMTSASEHPATSAKPTEAEASGKSSPR